jgi:putative pyruvate formate lyase activating enzyme
VKIEDLYTDDEISLLKECTLCPRECRVNRMSGEKGYCGTDSGMNIASVCIHRGEEPVISGENGICNIFFAGCNLRCVFCQNHEISRPDERIPSKEESFENILDKIVEFYNMGVKTLGFVSPSHVVPQVKAILRGLGNRGIKFVTVYNTNSYEKREIIKNLEGFIDIYLPDFKYVSSEIASKFSDASNYPEVALKAIKEMYFQKGSVLTVNNEGEAENGMLIRHLVIPGNTNESKNVLFTLSEELSPGVNVSLMSQYHPISGVSEIHDLNRPLYSSEYREVLDEMGKLGFRNGWIQELESHQNYNPDFKRENPFE